MKKSISVIIFSIALLFSGSVAVQADDLLPSDVYYKEHIAVNEVSVASPNLRGDGSSENDDDVNPGGDLEGDGTQVNGPIGDAIVPLLMAGLAYGSLLIYRRRKESV